MRCLLARPRGAEDDGTRMERREGRHRRHACPQALTSWLGTLPFHEDIGHGTWFGVVEKSGIGQNGNEGEIEVASMAS